MGDNKNKELGKIIKQRRLSMPLTLRGLGRRSSVSSSHLGRVERGERFPSANVLQRIAKPLGFEEDELMRLAGYLSPKPAAGAKKEEIPAGRLDPYVARVLAQETPEMQRTVIGILSVLKSIAKGIT